MAYEKPKPNEHKEGAIEAKKKRSKKRTPTHVPLPLSERHQVESDSNTEVPKKRKKKPNKNTKAGLPEVGSSSEKLESSKKTSLENKVDNPSLDEQQAEVAEELPEIESTQQDMTERVIPLRQGQAEVEVFVSDRLLKSNQKHESINKNQESNQALKEAAGTSESTEDEEITGSELNIGDLPEDSAENVRPKTKSADKSQRYQKTQEASPVVAATASSPFLDKWRQRDKIVQSSESLNSNQGNADAPEVAAIAKSEKTTPITSVPVSESLRRRSSETLSLFTGIIVGGVIEHIRHKRRERQADKKSEKNLNKAHLENQAIRKKSMEKVSQNERRQTELEKTIKRLQKVIANKSSGEVIVPALKSNKETLKASSAAAPATIEEAKRQFQEQAKRVIETEGKDQPEKKIPENHRIETSAWHAIEVDKKTGKAVEKSSFDYGEAFQQETHQEQLRKEIDAVSVDSSKVRERYKAAAKEGSLLTPVHSPKSTSSSVSPRKPKKSAVRNSDISQNVADKISNIEPLDIGLWIVLGIIVYIIIKLL